MQATPQYTSAEILEAGRRAEREGRLASAVQFYRHVLRLFPGSADAAQAAAGLDRLGPEVADGGARARRWSRHHFRFLPGRITAVLIEAGGLAALALAATRSFAPHALQALAPPPPLLAPVLALGDLELATYGIIAIIAGEGLRAMFMTASALRDVAELARQTRLTRPRR